MDTHDAAPMTTCKKRSALSPRQKGLLLFLLAAVLYLGIAVTVNIDATSRINEVYTGGGELEGWLWRYWWMKEVIYSLAETGNFPTLARFFMVAGSYPETGNVFDLELFSLPLERLFPAPLYYNIKALLALVLTALCGYLLGRYLFKSWASSFLLGTIIAFSPYVLAELGDGRIRHAFIFPVPLYVLFLFKTYYEKKIRHALAAGFFLGLCYAIYLFYGVFASFFTFLFIAYAVIFRRREGGLTWWDFARFAVILLVGLSLTVPFVLSYLERTIRGEMLTEVSWRRDFPSLQDLLNPGNLFAKNDPLANSLQRFRVDSPPWEYPFSLSYRRCIPLIVTLLALIPLPFVGKKPWLWLGAFLFFYLLSLGPYLKTGTGESYLLYPWGDPVGLLHLLFFKYVPFYSRLFSPIRVCAFVTLCVGVLAAGNLAFIFERARFPKSLGVILTLACVVIFLGQSRSSGAWPVQTTKLYIPQYYYRLAKEPDTGIIEMPFRMGDFQNFAQVIHGKKVLLGWADGGVPQPFPRCRAQWLARTDDLHDNTFIAYLESFNSWPRPPTPFLKADLDFLRKIGYNYIVLHERGCYILNPLKGKVIYEWMQSEFARHFGKPTWSGTEMVRERYPGMKLPEGPGPFPCNMCVFRMKDDR